MRDRKEKYLCELANFISFCENTICGRKAGNNSLSVLASPTRASTMRRGKANCRLTRCVAFQSPRSNSDRRRPSHDAARRVGDALHDDYQLAFREAEICGVGTGADASDRDLTPRTINNRLRHQSIELSKRSLMSSSFIKPSISAGSPISINAWSSPSS